MYNNNMILNLRYKARQSGKTSELLELAKILVSLGKKTAVIIRNEQTLYRIRSEYKEFIESDMGGLLLIGAATNLNFLRGHRFDRVLIDDLSLIDFNNIHQYILAIKEPILYATDDIANKKD